MSLRNTYIYLYSAIGFLVFAMETESVFILPVPVYLGKPGCCGTGYNRFNPVIAGYGNANDNRNYQMLQLPPRYLLGRRPNFIESIMNDRKEINYLNERDSKIVTAKEINDKRYNNNENIFINDVASSKRKPGLSSAPKFTNVPNGTPPLDSKFLEKEKASLCSKLECTAKELDSGYVCACNFITGNTVSFRNECDAKKHNCRFDTDFRVILNEVCPWEFESRRGNDLSEVDYENSK